MSDQHNCFTIRFTLLLFPKSVPHMSGWICQFLLIFFLFGSGRMSIGESAIEKSNPDPCFNKEYK